MKLKFLLIVYVGLRVQPGLSGINLGKFLIKRVIDLVRRDMPGISVSVLFYLLFNFKFFYLITHLKVAD